MRAWVEIHTIHLATLASGIALIIAFIAQYVFALEPCTLCYYQRIPFTAVLVFGFISIAIGNLNRKGVARFLGAIFMISAGLAFYHNGVEQHWWEAATSCYGGGVLPITVQDLQQSLSVDNMSSTCDNISWTLFGLSMAVYNTIMSLVLAAGCFWSARAKNG